MDVPLFKLAFAPLAIILALAATIWVAFELANQAKRCRDKDRDPVRT